MILNIAHAASCDTGRWQNKKMSWEDFLDDLREPVRTSETIAEYLAMTKDEQGKIKDVGGFVGGYLIGGRRRKDTVKFRQLVCLDVDFGSVDTWLAFRLIGYAGAMYSTHKHTPEDPRLRILFPLNRPATPEEYECVARIVAGWLGIDDFDDTTYQPERLMYYPSAAKDGEYLFDQAEGPVINIEDTLAELADWTDPTTWPMSEKAASKLKDRTRAAKAEDPTEKEGIVGAFCRAFTITEAIERFIPNVYSEADDGRFTFAGGSTGGGLVVYGDKFAYSHHNTDPCGDRLVNAFDMVRLHLYGEQDESAKEGTPASKMPSFQAMGELAAGIPEVKREITSRPKGDHADDFDDYWEDELQLDKNGKIRPTIHNVNLIVTRAPEFRGAFGYNEFEHREVALRALPWERGGGVYPRALEDVDDSELRMWLEYEYGVKASGAISDGLLISVRRNKFHPVRDYLERLEWDGVERLDRLFIERFDIEDTTYARAVTRKTLVAAVARIYQPGVKFDYALTLVGGQGIGKSSTLEALGGAWFSDSLNSINGKEALEQLQGSWIIELGELAGLRRAEVDAVKHFISQRKDRYRVAYGKRVEEFPRQCIFLGTTNENDFLRDVSGNRRWWVLTCRAQEIQCEQLDREQVAQIWAEAKHRYQAGETLYLDRELEAVAREIQDQHLEKDDRAGMIGEYLERLLPKGWEDRDPGSRRVWLEGTETGTEARQFVSTAEIWVECLGKNIADMKRPDSLEIGRIMKSFREWIPISPRRVKHYGKVRCYEKST